MKSTLAGLGLGALICLPCLALLIGGIGAMAGGMVAAVALHPLAQALGAGAALASVAGVVWYVRRGQSCAQCDAARTRGASVRRHELHG